MRSALAHSERGEIETWVHEFLRLDGNNLALSEGLRLEPRHYLGPVPLDVRGLVRCTGPEPTMKYRVGYAGFELRVRAIQDAILAGSDLPPLIVNFEGGRFEVNDGNHRLEALQRMGWSEFGTIVWTTEAADMVAFRERSRGPTL